MKSVNVNGDGDIVVTFQCLDRKDFDAYLLKIKRIPGGKFNATSKLWTFPKSNVVQIVDELEDDFEIAPKVYDIVTEVQAETLMMDKIGEKIRNLVAQELSTMNLDEPTGGITLYQHQKDGVTWLIEKQRGILADEMGLGKTLTALFAAKAYQRAVGSQIHVVCPVSLRRKWMAEAAIAGVTINTWSWAKQPTLDEAGTNFVLIADESHYMQSMTSIRSKSALRLSQRAFAVFLLTGTPIKNGRPVNLYPLLLACKHKLSKDKTWYERFYCDAKPTRFTKWDTSGAKNLDVLHVETQDVILRRKKKDCLDLPGMTRVTRGVEMSADALKVYEGKLKELKARYWERRRLGQIKSGAEVIVELNQLFQAGSMAKVETAVELAQEVIEEGGKVVLFTAFVESAHKIAAELKCKVLDGSKSENERYAMWHDEFQQGDAVALVCTIGAGGVGIDLTEAQTVIMVDRAWSPGDCSQAEDRLHRIGQNNKVTSIWLQCNSADEHRDEVLMAKNERIGLVLDGRRKTMRGVGNSTHEIALEVLRLIAEDTDLD